MERAVREISGRLSNPGTLRVGFLSGATYPDGTSVAAVAAFNEFGRTVKVTRDHPAGGELGGTYFQLPRPFFRNMIAAKSASWPAGLKKQLLATNYDAKLALERAGLGIKGQLQQSIRELTSPPLAPSTVAAKGFDKPLIDTGHMLNSVGYEVK